MKDYIEYHYKGSCLEYDLALQDLLNIKTYEFIFMPWRWLIRARRYTKAIRAKRELFDLLPKKRHCGDSQTCSDCKENMEDLNRFTNTMWIFTGEACPECSHKIISNKRWEECGSYFCDYVKVTK